MPAAFVLLDGFGGTPAGLVTRKTLSQYWSMSANYTYDKYGKMVSVQYPNGGTTFTYTYDMADRPIKLTDNQATPVDWVKDVVYNAAGQITQMKYSRDTSGSAYNTETRTYNILQQLTRLPVTHAVYPLDLDFEYRYSATQNNRRITALVRLLSLSPRYPYLPLSWFQRTRRRSRNMFRLSRNMLTLVPSEWLQRTGTSTVR
jgi:hypothetical protein